ATATGSGASTSVTDRSATPVIVEVTVAALLLVSGSVSVAVTEAVLVSVPAAVGLPVSVTVALPPAASGPSGQASTLVPTQPPPWLGVAPVRLKPGGSGSVTWTLLAAPGPVLVTVIV